MPKDVGHEETEDILRELEKRISQEYKRAEKEVAEKLNDYLRRFEKKDEIKRKALKNGLITQEEYDKWRVGQIMIGQRWQEMRDTLAEDFTNANALAKSMAYGYMPDVYALNHNYGTYQVEHAALVDTSYTLYDRDTVEYLFNDNNTFYHAPGRKITDRINRGLDEAWNKKNVQSAMLQGILQGEAIGKIATRLSETVGEQNRKVAIRNARTMTTGIENAGRVRSYDRAKDMGIDMQKQWLATLDGRTRHWHRELDGVAVDNDKPFTNEYGDIMYPGDPAADPANIYNCRCTLMASLKGFEKDVSDLDLRHDKNLGDMSYEEWKESHDSYSDPITKQDDIEETMRRTYGAEYSHLDRLNREAESGNVESGAISGALNPDSKEASEHAERYYGLVRNMTTDVDKIAEVSGFSREEIQEIKNYVFIDEHDLISGHKRFDPSYDMAESWQRLREGRPEPHDITLLNHELMELKLVEEGKSYEEAHRLTEAVYNYATEADEYNDKVRKNKKSK